MLKHHQLCSNILYKEQFLPAEELGGAAGTVVLMCSERCTIDTAYAMETCFAQAR